MLIAEAYRKLPSMVAPGAPGAKEWDPLEIEDLATGDAFGALRYLPRSLFLLPLLRSIRRVSNGAPLPADTVSRVEKGLWKLDLRFWPSYDLELKDWIDAPSVEPDVVIELRGSEGPELLVIVECKFRSSKLGADPSQLARQYWVGRRLVEEARALGRDLEFVLLCVTLYRTPPLVKQPVLSADGRTIVGDRDRLMMPHQQVAEYLRLKGKQLLSQEPALTQVCEAWADEAADHVYHASWRSIAKVFEDGLSKMTGMASGVVAVEAREAVEGMLLLAKEACRILLDLRRLRGFQGFDEIAAYDLEPARAGRNLFLDTSSLRFTGGRDAR